MANANDVSQAQVSSSAVAPVVVFDNCGYAPAQTLCDANKVMRHIRREQKEIDKIHAAAETQREELRKELELVDKWESEQSRSHENSKEFFESLLVGFVHKELDGTKKKSLHLIGGVAGWSPSRAEYIFPIGEDKPSASNKKLLEFIKANNLDEFIETKESVKWTDLKKKLSASSDGLDVEVNGIKIPHLAKKLSGGKFYVKIDGDTEEK